jgi:hypothetical protein
MLYRIQRSHFKSISLLYQLNIFSQLLLKFSLLEYYNLILLILFNYLLYFIYPKI